MKLFQLFLFITLLLPESAFADKIVINVVGDIMLAGKGKIAFDRLGYDYPFAATVAALKDGDLAIGNLEAPLTNKGSEFINKKFRFRTDPQAAPQ